jgi:hypothetical protein
VVEHIPENVLMSEDGGEDGDGVDEE